MGFVIVPIDTKNVRTKLKFVALPVPEIIGSTGKISAVPGYAHAPFSRRFLRGFCSDGRCESVFEKTWSATQKT